MHLFLFRELQQEIDNLKQIVNQHEARITVRDYCPETESEGGDVSDNIHDPVDSDGHDANTCSEELDDNVILASLVHRSRSSSSIKASKIHGIPKKADRLCDVDEDTRGRKRVRMVISDDESDESPEIDQSKRIPTNRTDSLSTSGTRHLKTFYISPVFGMPGDCLLISLYTFFYHQQSI
jgi:hypothetical protein